MALPDFLVAGAPKAGTTAVHAALARHPSLYMSPVKEPKFFLTDGPPPSRGGPRDVRTYREHVWRRDDYEALFEPAPAGCLRGESTPFLPVRPCRAAAHPGADPARQADRDPARPGGACALELDASVSAGLDPVDDVVRACAEEDAGSRRAGRSSGATTALSRYGEQLEQPVTRCSPGAGHGLPYRALIEEPARVLDRICAFLGVQEGILTEVPRRERHRPSRLTRRTARCPRRCASAPRPARCYPAGRAAMTAGWNAGCNRTRHRASHSPGRSGRH